MVFGGMVGGGGREGEGKRGNFVFGRVGWRRDLKREMVVCEMFLIF